MLWATDITCTNTIAGDITGNAGTATNGATSSAVIADNAIVRGDGGTKGVQGSTATIDDSGNLIITGNYTLRDAIAATKAYKFFTSGSDLDIAGAGKSIYFSVYDNADFSGEQRNKILLLQGSDTTQLNKRIEFVNGFWGTANHVIDGAGGATFSKVTLNAGTATAGTAPLKFTSGVVNTTPEAGALEWNGTDLFITI
jgi:hypothetical protein